MVCAFVRWSCLTARDVARSRMGTLCSLCNHVSLDMRSLLKLFNTLNTATLCTPHKVYVRPLTADSVEALPQELTEGGVRRRDNDNDWDQIRSLQVPSCVENEVGMAPVLYSEGTLNLNYDGYMLYVYPQGCLCICRHITIQHAACRVYITFLREWIEASRWEQFGGSPLQAPPQADGAPAQGDLLLQAVCRYGTSFNILHVGC